MLWQCLFVIKLERNVWFLNFSLLGPFKQLIACCRHKHILPHAQLWSCHNKGKSEWEKMSKRFERKKQELAGSHIITVASSVFFSSFSTPLLATLIKMYYFSSSSHLLWCCFPISFSSSTHRMMCRHLLWSWLKGADIFVEHKPRWKLCNLESGNN